jgi:hypothetical protein
MRARVCASAVIVRVTTFHAMRHDPGAFANLEPIRNFRRAEIDRVLLDDFVASNCFRPAHLTTSSSRN